jgi:ABC-2 type transport system permease protein
VKVVWAIGALELKRFFRDRSNLFFVFVFPMLLILVVGLQFGEGSQQTRVSLAGADSALRGALVTALEEEDSRVTLAEAASVREELARGRVDVGLFLDEADAAAFEAGKEVEIEVVSGTRTTAQAALQQVRTATQEVATGRGQLAALVEVGVPEDRARSALATSERSATPPEVQVVDVDDVAREFSGVGQYEVGAAQQTLLFVFLASLTGSATLIQARRLGVLRRTLAAPVSTRQAVAGQAFGRFVIALAQGSYIMFGTALLFGVDWGNPGLAALVLALFCLVAGAAAMVIGSVMDNDSAAAGVGIGLGLVLAGLGGAMMPLELFSDTLRAASRFTPHSWAYEALADITRHDANLADIAPQLGVLAGMAAALLLLGSWLLRRSLERAL